MISTLFINLLTLFTGPREVACSCVEDKIAEDRKISISYTKAALVLVGRVTKAEPVTTTETVHFQSQHSGRDSVYTVSREEIRYTFAVTQLIKGEGVGKTVVITSAAQSAACGVRFAVDTDYLVYSHLVNKQTGPQGEAQKVPPYYTIGLCSRHQELRAVKSSELRQLRRIAQKASGEHKVTWFELGD